MNIKKAISLLFLLFANAAILVHIVEFHHHDSQLSAVMCAENKKHHCAENTEQHKCPDSENAHKCCIIENCLLSNSITKTDDFKLTEPIVNNSYIIINNIPACQTLQITDWAGLSFQQNPYVLLFYSEFVSLSIGLRAPPVC